MLFSQALIPTLKEDPTDAQNASHALLMRGGFIRRVGAGIYEYLPLGLRVLRNIESIVRREMDRAGALELQFPALLPAEYFKETGRWDRFGETLLRLKDRKGADFHLGPTHEEIVTDLARHVVKSYRDLPKNLYQIQTKFRDEARPRGGLLRCREFLMKDAYSFDADENAALASYERMRAAYAKIFDSIGLVYRMVAADSGAMGGSSSAEFQVLTNSGEDAIVACDRCSYAANVEAATVRPDPEVPKPATLDPLGKVHTPGHGTIAEVSAFLKVPPDRMLKSLLYTAKDGPLAGTVFMCVVRGDQEVNETKLARAAAASEIFLASDADIEKATGAKVGFAGPVGFRGKVFVDRGASVVVNGTSGANETDYHTTGVQLGRDYQGDVIDVRLAKAGDGCPSCDGILQSFRGIEGGHIFVLGTHYSAKMGASFLAENGERRPLVMGCYGIGISRLLAAAVEQHHDDDGILWPAAIAPYDVEIVTIGADAPVHDAARTILAGLEARGISVLWDDREERPGVKFKDADLIGIALRVMIGTKGLAAGGVELKPRSEKDPKKVQRVPVEQAVQGIAERIAR